MLYDRFVNSDFIDDRTIFDLYLNKNIDIEVFNNVMLDIMNPMITIALRQGFKKWELA